MVPEISNQEMATLQAEHPGLGIVLQWLEKNSLSMICSEANPWKLETSGHSDPQVCVMDGLLIRYFEEKNLVQLIIPSTIRWKLVAHTHDGPPRAS